ncbi:MAG: ERCC4 domain-containing protein [Candidatus Sumerlaeota bacterium]|nr:ERCC4 domain-containing protein [Candidatus Sumerlaeota bacterium]
MRVDLTPVIQIDSREQCPLLFHRFGIERATLACGDYTLKGFGDFSNPQIIFERKSLPDLISSLTLQRDRFLREVELLRRFAWRGLVVEGLKEQVEQHHYRSQANPSAILQTLVALELRANLHVEWCADATGAAAYVENAVRMFVRGLIRQLGPLLSAGVNLSIVDLTKAKTPAAATGTRHFDSLGRELVTPDAEAVDPTMAGASVAQD